jgi:3-dehydroquinate synthase
MNSARLWLRPTAAGEFEGETVSETTTVQVQLSERSYPIEIGSGNLARTGQTVAALGDFTHAVVITDTNVEPLHATVCAERLAAAVADVDLLVVEAGESSKSVEMADRLWHELLQLGADRKTLVVAAGGGVVGDLAGFVAATFARGLPFVQIPTTLLAQVDSSVGGKTGVNLPGAKNMVGVFWQPLGVVIDTEVLETLPPREYRAGLAEVVKYGVILDAEFFAYLEAQQDALNRRQADVLRTVIARCCRLKADVVENDERETTGLRAVLNYGHTFGHAIEAETGYGTLLHGEAVSIGMICASRLAERLGRIDSELTQRQLDLLQALGLPVALPDVDREVLLSAMRRDKKVAHGRLRFVLPSRLGCVELVGGVSADDVRAVLE